MSASHAAIAAGPVLFARGADTRRARLAALVVLREPSGAPALRPMGGEAITPVVLARLAAHRFVRYDFELPVGVAAHYTLDGARHPVVTDLGDALRIGYLSCNGLERGDRERGADERNLMWRRLAAEHARAPFALLLHGGDQLYADEVSEAHPTLAAWAASPLEERDRYVFDDEARRAATRFFVERYTMLYAQPDIAPLLARVPSLMMWDDHDIFDGWGSHPPALLDSAVGRGLFAVARRAFLLFQCARCADGRTPDESLSFAVRFPGFAVVAPDLRSERRPERVMGPAGWRRLERDLDAARGVERLLLMSSVPLLGPRLSLVERHP